MTYSLRLAIIMCNIEELETLPAGTQLTKKKKRKKEEEITATKPWGKEMK